VTEKFFQSIDYGAIPIVIGAPNIQVASSRAGNYIAVWLDVRS
jgi:hypothetical protein